MALLITAVHSTSIEHHIHPPRWTIAAFSFALITVALWLPFGLNIAEFSDTWVLYHAIEQRTLPLINLQDSRLFYALGYYIPYLLTPDSFVGANLFGMVLIWAKAFTLYAILRQFVPKRPSLAFVAGALTLVFPADTGTFWITSMNVNLPILMYLISVCLLLWYWRSPRLLKLVGMWLTLTISSTYEATYLLILVTPLCLIWLQKGISKRVLLVSAAWYVIPAVMFARLAILYVQGGGAFGYQQAVLQVGLSAENPLRNMLNSLARIYERTTVTIWVESIEAIKTHLDRTYLVIALGTTGVAMVGGWLHARQSDERSYVRLNTLLLFVGLAIIGLGFAPYLPTEYRDTNYRNLFLPSIGAAIFLTSLLNLIAHTRLTVRRILFILGISTWFAFSSRLPILVVMASGTALLVLPRRIFFMLSVGALIFIGTFALLRQHQLYAEMPLRQQWIMEAIARQAPSLDDNSFIVVLDETPDQRGYHAFEWRRDIVVSALAVLYEKPSLDAAFCIPNQDVYGFFREQCAFREDGFHALWTRGETVVPYEHLILFRYSDTFGAELLQHLPEEIAADSLYNPETLIDDSAPLPLRLHTMFEDVPFGSQPPMVDFGVLR